MDFAPNASGAFDDDACYQALSTRDARFDGRVFVGVTSTGIYCRTVCRVRTPMRKNCRFFGTPAAAEAAGFRPCMKCRPEIAPGAAFAWTVMDASRTLARQAAAALDAQAANGAASSLVEIATRLGVSDRHLRRIFQAEHGVTPLQYMQTRRLLLAKQLLTDTRMPIAQVAFASGFASLRRFNAAFVASYRMSPGRLRGVSESDMNDGDDQALCVQLAYRAPYDIAALTRFIALRAIPGIEHVAGWRIRRSLRADAITPNAGWIEAEFAADRPIVLLRFSPVLASASRRVVAAARRWLDLDAMPEAIAAGLGDLPGSPGLRLPGSLDAFELALRAILGQQVTVAGARTLAGRLVEHFGEAMPTPWPEVTRSFPQPAVLAALQPGQIAELGIIRTRAAAIVAIAQAWHEIAPLLAPTASSDALIERLCALPGIGRWTAHYIAMRALGWPDAFPPNDVAVLKAMKQRYGTSSQREAEEHAQAWRPWRAYAVLRLWNTLTPVKETTP